MAHTISVETKTFEHIISQLDTLTKDVAAIKKRILDEEPPEGTEAWWEWSDKKALEEYKKGEYYELRDKDELDDFFNNILSDKSNEKYDHKLRQKSRKTAQKDPRSYHQKAT